MTGTIIKASSVALMAVLVAAGVAAPAEAARADSRTSARQCHKGGWTQRLTSTGQDFASPGDCTSYAAHGGALRSNPYPPAKQACDELRGSTFAVDVFRYYTTWTCVWRAAELSIAAADLLSVACREAGGEWGGGVTPGIEGLVGFRCIDNP